MSEEFISFVKLKSRIERFCELSLKITGFNVKERKLHLLQIFIVGFFLFTLSVLTMIQVVFYIEEGRIIEEDAFQVIMSTTALQVTSLKLIQFVKKRNILFDLLNSLEIKLSKCSAESEMKEEKGMYLLVKMLYIFSLGSVFLAFLQTNVTSSDLNNSKPLYPITVPEDKNKHAIMFYGIVILQTVGGCFFTLVNAAAVSVFAHSINFVCCQLRLLAISYNNNVIKNHDNKDLLTAIEQYNKHIKFHLHLLSIVEKLQLIFSKIIFAEFVSSQFLSCLLVMLTIKKIRSGLVLSAMQHIALIPALLLMSYTYFYLGTKLTSTSLDARTDMYASEWYSQGRSYNKMLSIMLERMSKPMVMMAASIIPVTLSSFLKACRAGYSYFNFLDAMYRR